jgi:AcrR family transcriptional regulator
MAQARGLGIDGLVASSGEDVVPDDARARPHPRQHSFAREQGADLQRARIISAMVAVAAEHGFLGASVGHVVMRAGVSRGTFYEFFDGRESCFLAAFDWGVERAAVPMVRAYALETSWREQVRGAVAALLAFLDSEPELARVCVIEALGAGSAVRARQERVLRRTADALLADAPPPRGAPEPPLLAAETIVGGMFAAIHTRLSLRAALAHWRSRSSRPGSSHVGPLSELLGQLMALVVLPYLGPEAAGEELTRPHPDPHGELLRAIEGAHAGR